MIEVKNLTKIYGNHTAVNNLSFSILPGKIYGFLGPNGAGKSTTMNIITGTLAPTSGTVTVNGSDIYEEPIKAKSHIGYLPEIPPLYTDMTPLEYLTFVAEAKGVDYDKIRSRVKEVMSLTGLLDIKNRLIKNLSKGYRQRVGIAMAMLGDPDVIILDEPTVGLDPLQIIEIRQLIRKLGETKTVILSSHILAEVAEVCDHVMIISHGRLVANDSLDNLIHSVNCADCLHITVRASADKAIPVISAVEGVISVEERDSEEGTCSLYVTIEKGSDPRDGIFFALSEARLPILALELEKITLESVFLSLTAEDELYEEDIADEDSDETNDDSDDDEDDEDSDDDENSDDDSKGEDNGDDYKPLFS